MLDTKYHMTLKLPQIHLLGGKVKNLPYIYDNVIGIIIYCY